MSFVFFTSLEILFALVLILEIKNKKKLIAFENALIISIKKFFKRRLSSSIKSNAQKIKVH
ncbi:MAG: hypothetical protein IIX39_02025 [Clostridia bacterium]|nr:hypothetical protein [Clostridia bacterium]